MSKIIGQAQANGVEIAIAVAKVLSERFKDEPYDPSKVDEVVNLINNASDQNHDDAANVAVAVMCQSVGKMVSMEGIHSDNLGIAKSQVGQA